MIAVMRGLLHRLRERLQYAEDNGDAMWDREWYRRGVRPPYAAPWWQARIDVSMTVWGIGVEVYADEIMPQERGVGVGVHLGPLVLSVSRYPGSDGAA